MVLKKRNSHVASPGSAAAPDPEPLEAASPQSALARCRETVRSTASGDWANSSVSVTVLTVEPAGIDERSNAISPRRLVPPPKVPTRPA